jgi:type 2A phosphatase activator TIP41
LFLIPAKHFVVSLLLNQIGLRLQREIGIPLPEMIFGNNQVTISNETGFELTFRAQDALELVDKTPESNKHIQVAYANEWGKKRLAD